MVVDPHQKKLAGKRNPIDEHVGARLKLRRTDLGLSQEKLADLLGISLQQVQKYERGANRVSASRLHEVSRALDTEVGWFFEDMSPEVAARSPAALARAQRRTEPLPRLLLSDTEEPSSGEIHDLVRAFLTIDDPLVRRRLLDLTRTIALPTDLSLPKK